jgi:hypothetical protein
MQKITIEATINADLKKTWDYYTLPEHITNGISQIQVGIVLLLAMI